MIKLDNIETFGLETAIRGMRNPMNSWDKSDTIKCWQNAKCTGICKNNKSGCHIGANDLKLMKSLIKAGTDHRKFLRMINVTMDITGPLYWWKEFDTYKVGTVANSCSTMHKIHEKGFSLDDFSYEHLEEPSLLVLQNTIRTLNECRDLFLGCSGFMHKYGVLDKKDYWWQMIQLLPSSYNQKRTVQLNYEVLLNIYHSRKNHKLDEWRKFCEIIKTLPYMEEFIDE